jgi:hypothetical protein
MSTDRIFELVNAIAFFSWLVLFIIPYSKVVQRVLLNLVVGGLSGYYTYLFATSFDPTAFSEFSTLEGLMGLFTSKEAVLMGWVHYLAFDLVAGIFIARDAEKEGFSSRILPLFLLPCFMAGPLGWFAYFITKVIRNRGRGH